MANVAARTLAMRAKTVFPGGKVTLMHGAHSHVTFGAWATAWATAWHYGQWCSGLCVWVTTYASILPLHTSVCMVQLGCVMRGSGASLSAQKTCVAHPAVLCSRRHCIELTEQLHGVHQPQPPAPCSLLYADAPALEPLGATPMKVLPMTRWYGHCKDFVGLDQTSAHRHD
jgi:hypothetical protein